MAELPRSVPRVRISYRPSQAIFIRSRLTSSDQLVKVCDETAWIRFVAKPVSNPPGWIGIGLVALGLGGFGGLFRAKAAPRPPSPVEPGPEPRRPIVEEPAQEPRIPSDATPPPTPTVTVTPDEGSHKIKTDDRQPVTAIRVAVDPGSTTTTLTEEKPS